MSERSEPPDDPTRIEERSRFLNSLGTLRPRLHRLCARMCGSVLDGEDLVQETLAAAAYKLKPMPFPALLERSLFRMSLERCMTFIRLDLGHRERSVVYGEGLSRVIGPQQQWNATPLEDRLAARVSVLQPRERAVVVLSDVLGFPIWDTVALISSTFGYAKLALLRARALLRELPPLAPSAPIDAELRVLLQAYADCFNRLDGQGLHQLVRDDARVEIVGAFSGGMRDLDAVYAGSYAATPWEWRLSVALVDGDPVLITNRRLDSAWRPYSAIRIWWQGGRVARIRDYMHIQHVLRDARIEPAAAL